MKFLSEYRDPKLAESYLNRIHKDIRGSWTLMEVCGGQTHALLKYCIPDLLPDGIRLIHGPGCPVCVTPLEQLDKALAIARHPEVIFTSFGDMLRVPGSTTDLLQIKAAGSDVRIVYSPLEAVRLAQENPDREVVFFAVGFETTAPGNAMAVFQAQQLGLSNFSLLVSHVLVPPAITAILDAPDNQVQGFLAAGHVCAVMGFWEYEPIAEKYQVPIVVTGFEPLDLLAGIHHCLQQLETGQYSVENQYKRTVSREGNAAAQQRIRDIFEVGDQKWRGIGTIPGSGLHLREAYRSFDAEIRFEVTDISTAEDGECISGLVLQGKRRPDTCPAFGTRCSPEHPLGATMVSTEGACAAYYRYRK